MQKLSIVILLLGIGMASCHTNQSSFRKQKFTTLKKIKTEEVAESDGQGINTESSENSQFKKSGIEEEETVEETTAVAEVEEVIEKEGEVKEEKEEPGSRPLDNYSNNSFMQQQFMLGDKNMKKRKKKEKKVKKKK